MSQLNKLKDRIMEFVGRYETYVMAGVRFVIGFAAFRLIIMNLPYSDVLASFPFALVLALACCFLPAGVMLFVAAILILVELYALSMMLCLIMGLVFLIMFCLYTRFTSRKGLYAVLTPIMSVLGVPYTMPVVCGLRGEPYAVISVICGEATYFMLRHITINATLYIVPEDENAANILTMATTELLLDQEMYIYLIGFAAGAIVTFCISRLRFNRSHLIAAAAGIGSQLAVICGTEYFMGMGSQSLFIRILVGCIVSFLILLIVSFFTHNLDYKRVENVQFEDDDYYYFVRAIPKSFLPPKNWNPQSNAQKRQLEGSGGKTDAQATVRQRRKKTEETAQADQAGKAAQTQLAAEAAKQAAEAEAAEKAAADAAAERAAAATQAISEAAGHKAPSKKSIIDEIEDL